MVNYLFRKEVDALIWPIRFIRFTLDWIERLETPAAAGGIAWPEARVR